MRRGSKIVLVLASCIDAGLLPACFGQDQSSVVVPVAPVGQNAGSREPLPKFGLALTAGTTGAGIQAATAVFKHTNVRFGFNYFSLGLAGTDTSNDLKYNAKLRVESAEILVDQYLGGPFHISGGAMIYDGFQGTGSVSVPAGQTLTLNNFTYFSSPSNPVTGTASIGARKVAPELLLGFGNLLPRSARHFTANFDLGVAFQGSPNAKLNLTGSTCAGLNSGCLPINGNAEVQNNIAAEQAKVNNTLKPFQFYPIIRLSFGYKF